MSICHAMPASLMYAAFQFELVLARIDANRSIHHSVAGVEILDMLSSLDADSYV